MPEKEVFQEPFGIKPAFPRQSFTLRHPVYFSFLSYTIITNMNNETLISKAELADLKREVDYEAEQVVCEMRAELKQEFERAEKLMIQHIMGQRAAVVKQCTHDITIARRAIDCDIDVNAKTPRKWPLKKLQKEARKKNLPVELESTIPFGPVRRKIQSAARMSTKLGPGFSGIIDPPVLAYNMECDASDWRKRLSLRMQASLADVKEETLRQQLIRDIEAIAKEQAV